ncbi:fibronectin type III [Flammeovirgaceae bacterium 311]|nr:fibronectin type III [Flammeovirgaceae bacterium 311]
MAFFNKILLLKKIPDIDMRYRSQLMGSLSLILLLLLSCCSKENEPESTFTLTVNGGSGSGKYASGSLVSIAANNPSQGEIFEKWIGDIPSGLDANEAATTFVMPARHIEITATYTTVSDPIAITIDKATRFQTMDGFGFFGGRDVWWSSPNENHFYSEAWLEKIVADLGITIWRNELYPHNPPSGNNANRQDAHWEKQKPMVQALQAKADQHGVDLKIILTAWSAPGAFKWNATNYDWAGDQNAQRGPGEDGDYWPERDGGTLNPNKYQEYAQWWIEGIQMYKDAGVDVYAVSMQNEPAFWQTTFNSTFYTTHWYAEMINAVIPIIKAAHPEVKVFGSENMLSMEGKDINYPHFYHNTLKKDPTAMNYIDILAVHGYHDGVNASSGTELAKAWTNHKEQFSAPANKKAWMTETSGYVDSWEEADDTPGAFNLASDIQSALLFGDVSGWVFWQGSRLGRIDAYNLMDDLTVGKKYHASRNFYRFIRPGAVRVLAQSADEAISVSAFEHAQNGSHTIVLINSADTPGAVNISMSGSEAPENYEMFISSATKNSESAGTVPANQPIILPARAVVTLQAGGSVLGTE